MKTINTGLGKEIEISEDVEQEIDPDSMLDEPFVPKKNTNIFSLASEISENNIIVLAEFVNETATYNIAGVFKKLLFSNNNFQFEFFIFKKNLFTLMKIKNLHLNKILFYSDNEQESQEEILLEAREVKKIEFESFGKQIKCSVFL